jgi:hypothetical protein
LKNLQLADYFPVFCSRRFCKTEMFIGVGIGIGVGLSKADFDPDADLK